MAELISALADAKIQAAEIQDLLSEKDKAIADLEKAFEIQSTLNRYQDGYYVIDESGNPYGDPFCSYCWEVNHKAVHLHWGDKRDAVCGACKNIYQYRRVPILEKNSSAQQLT